MTVTVVFMVDQGGLEVDVISYVEKTECNFACRMGPVGRTYVRAQSSELEPREVSRKPHPE